MAQTWDATFETQPANAETPASGDDRIRAHKEGVRERAANEHTTYVADGTAGNYLLDWNHRKGSAKGYFQDAEPTKRPNGSTNLSSDDAGRIWFDDDNGDLPYYYDGTNWVGMTREIARFSIQGNLATGQNVVPPIVFPRGCTILKVSARVLTAPVGAALQIDLEANGAAGSSIFSAAFQIADGANSATSTSIDADGTLSADDYLSIDIDQVGSTTPGADLSVTIEARIG